MLRFKTFLSEGLLKEYLTDGQREAFSHVKMTDKARKDTDHFFGEGNDLVKEPLIPDYSKSETHEDVESHLGVKIPDEHYIKGVATDKHGRLAKIGKQIKDTLLLSRFANDPARSNANKPTKNYITVVRGTEVAGQTNPVPNEEHPTGHSWANQSCKNLVSGCNRHFLEPEIQEGSVLFRVHDETGKEIHRTIMHPYHNNKGETIYGLAGQYGVQNDRYTKHAHDIAARLSNSNATGNFNINSKIYQDHAPTTIENPHLSSEAIGNILSDPNAMSLQKLNLLKNHKNITSEHIFTAINNPNSNYGEYALHNPNVQYKHIKHIMDSPHIPLDLKELAVTHPTFNANHITDFLNNFTPTDTNKKLLNTITQNTRFNSGHLDTIMSKNLLPHMTEYGVKRLVRSSAINDSHIDKLIDHAKLSPDVIRNMNLSSDHITKLLNKNNPELNTSIYAHTAFNDSHVDHIINSDLIKSAPLAALSEHNLKAHHISGIIDKLPHIFQSFNNSYYDPITEISSNILRKSAFNSDHVDKLLKLNNIDLNREIVNLHPRKLSKDNITDLLNNDNNYEDVDSNITNYSHLHSDHIHKLISKHLENYGTDYKSESIINTLSEKRNFDKTHADRLISYTGKGYKNLDRKLAFAHQLSYMQIHHIINKHHQNGMAYPLAQKLMYQPAFNEDHLKNILSSSAYTDEDKNDINTEYNKIKARK